MALSTDYTMPDPSVDLAEGQELPEGWSYGAYVARPHCRAYWALHEDGRSVVARMRPDIEHRSAEECAEALEAATR